MEILRVYIDASVFGGYFDREFEAGTRPFFEGITNSIACALISDLLVGELLEAPSKAQDLLEQVLSLHGSERLATNLPVEDLRDAYLRAGVLSERWGEDALHVALASVSGADALVSWNFKHLVHPLRIRGFNEVNAMHGYPPIAIMTPEDVSRGWEERGDETDD